MTVGELIEYLSGIEPDTEVVIDDDDFMGEGDYLSIRGVLAMHDGEYLDDNTDEG